MNLIINGNKELIDSVNTLEDFIKARRLRPERIVLEHNGEIVRREAWAAVALKDNDKIEIISFVGGG